MWVGREKFLKKFSFFGGSVGREKFFKKFSFFGRAIFFGRWRTSKQSFFFFFCLMDAFIYKSRCVNNSTVTKKNQKSTKFRLPKPK